MNNNSNKTIITAVSLTLFFVLIVTLEQVISITSPMSMLLTVLKKGAVYCLVAVSMNLLNGFTGLFSLGQAGFMLIGAYTYAIFSIPVGDRGNVYQYYDHAIKLSFPEVLGKIMGGPGMLIGVFISILLAGLVAAAVAFLVGLPVLRLKSNYLTIATLGFSEIIRAVFQWGKLGPITNGSNIIRSYVRQNAFRVEIGGTVFGLSTFFLVFSAAICIAILVLLVNSSYGRAFKAIREDEIAAEAMGINLYRYKQLSFCISSFFTGVGGALLAIFMGTVMADNFRANITYELLLIVVLGGLGSISGSVIGALLYVFASEWWLRGLDSGVFLGISSPLFRNGFRLVVFAVAIMIVVLFFRRGIMGDKEIPYLLGRWKEKLFILFRKIKAGKVNG